MFKPGLGLLHGCWYWKVSVECPGWRTDVWRDPDLEWNLTHRLLCRRRAGVDEQYFPTGGSRILWPIICHGFFLGSYRPSFVSTSHSVGKAYPVTPHSIYLHCPLIPHNHHQLRLHPQAKQSTAVQPTQENNGSNLSFNPSTPSQFLLQSPGIISIANTLQRKTPLTCSTHQICLGADWGLVTLTFMMSHGREPQPQLQQKEWPAWLMIPLSLLAFLVVTAVVAVFLSLYCSFLGRIIVLVFKWLEGR